MKDIPRYRPVSNDRYGITDDADGKLCEYRDYALLKAEVERLTAIVGADAIDREHGMCCDASAQVERLTKAGDAMLLALNKPDDIFDNTDKNKSIANWNAAKEGKQP